MSPLDMPRQLLTLAERDYQAALILARAENPQKEAAGFHLQQSAEKALKAWLARTSPISSRWLSWLDNS